MPEIDELDRTPLPLKVVDPVYPDDMLLFEEDGKAIETMGAILQ